MRALVQYYLVWLLAGGVAWPLVRCWRAGGAAGWLLARVLGPALLALAALHAARWTGRPLAFGVAVAFPCLATASLAVLLVSSRFRKGSSAGFLDPGVSRQALRRILTAECLVALGYAVLAMVFGYHYGSKALGERPLDLGLVNWLMNAPAFPPEHFWAAGQGLFYYYFGCLQAGVLGLAAAVPGEQAYFAGLCAVWTSAAAAGWLSARLQGARKGGAFLTAAALVLMSTAAPLYHWARSGIPPWHGDAFARAVRVIPGTINEIPASALWMSELHAHVLALPLFVLLPPLFVRMVRRPSLARFLLFSGVSAALFMTDAWLAPAAGMACVFTTLFRAGGRRIRTAALAGGCAAAVLALASPLLLGFRGHPVEFRLVEQSTTQAVHLAVLFGPIIMLLLLLLGAAGGRLRRGPAMATGALACVGLLLIAFCELAYLETGFPPPHERQNTVMRFHWAAYLCLALAAAPLTAGAGASRRPWLRRAAWGWTGAFVLLGLLSPLARVGGLLSDGEEWTTDPRRALDPDHTGTVRVAEFFRTRPPGTVLLESSGLPYQGFATVSAMSGRRTLLGELDKLVSHGMTIEEIRRRQRDLMIVYTDAPEAAAVLETCGADYVVLGPAEFRAYPGASRSLPQKYPVAFRSGKVLVLRVR